MPLSEVTTRSRLLSPSTSPSTTRAPVVDASEAGTEHLRGRAAAREPHANVNGTARAGRGGDVERADHARARKARRADAHAAGEGRFVGLELGGEHGAQRTDREHLDVWRAATLRSHDDLGPAIAIEIATGDVHATGEAGLERVERHHLSDVAAGERQHADAAAPGALRRNQLVDPVAIDIAARHPHATVERRHEGEELEEPAAGAS